MTHGTWLLVCAMNMATSAAGRTASVDSGPAGDHPAPAEATVTADRRRLVRVFDFDEKPLGNFEPIPMQWTRHYEWGFPQHLEATFDEHVGHRAPPSFRMKLNGGSIAFHYRARTIEIIPTSDYVVLAYVRTQGLRRARAFLSAAMMDRTGSLIGGSEVFSERVGGEGHDSSWQRLSVTLPGGVRNARYIALSLWLAQPGAERVPPRGTRSSADQIEDIHGAAWFDDIGIYRLPRVRLATGTPGNVFSHDHRPELLALVGDAESAGLDARLTVRDADSTLVWSTALAVSPPEQSDPRPVGLPPLGPGLYTAELAVSAATGLLSLRTVRFAVLAARLPPGHAAEPSDEFGLTVSSISPDVVSDLFRLIQELGVKWLKVPVWSPQRGQATDRAAKRQGLEQHLTRLAGPGREIVGGLGFDVGQEPAVGTLLDVLDGSSAAWKPSLAYLWSVYGGLVHWWQVGADDDDAVVWDARLPGTAARLCEHMRGFVTTPLLAMPTSVWALPDGRRFESNQAGLAESVFVPCRIPPSGIASVLGGRAREAPLWVTIEPLPAGRYPRTERAADLVRRLVWAKAAGPEAIFLREPWGPAGDTLAPTDDYLVYRALADALGGTEYVGRIELDTRAECHAFDRGGKALLIAWDDYAPPEGREHWMALEPGGWQADPWGRVRRLPAQEGESPVHVGRMPAIVGFLPTWLVRFRQGLHLDPSHVEASLEPHGAFLRFANPFREPISGDVRLVAPAGWEVRPTRFSFALAPGATCAQNVTLRFPLYESAGRKVLLAELQIEANRQYRVRLPVWFELGLNGVEVATFAQRTGRQVVVRQTVTNHTTEVLHFYSYLAPADRERLNRVIANLQPGQTVTRDYVLDDAGGLSGRKMRIGLREVGGTRVWNRLLEVP